MNQSGTGSVTVKRSGTSWIQINIIDPETRLRSVNVIYCVLAIIFLLNNVLVTLYFPKYYTASALITPYPFVAFGIISIILGRMWKDKGFILLFLLLIFKTIRLWADTSVSELPGACIYAFCVCYPVGRILSEKYRRRLLLAFCSLWTIGMVVLSSLAIYVAWTGQGIANYTTGAIWIDTENRLSPIFHPVQAGALATASIASALVAIYMVKQRIVRSLFVIGIVIIFIFGILTASRINHIANAALLSVFIILLFHNRIRDMKWWHWIGLITIGAVIMVGFTYIQSWGIRLFNYLKTTRGGLVSYAMAEDIVTLKPRDIQIDNGLDSFLNGRIDTWRTMFMTLAENPKLLLWGAGDVNPMILVNELRSSLGLEFRSHMHNSWLQMLLVDGVSGFLLYMGFTVYIIWYGIKLMFRKPCLLWQKFLALPVFVCMLTDLIDITSYPDTGHPSVTLLFLFAGMIVVYSKERQKT